MSAEDRRLKRKRLSPELRREEFLDKATEFFAEEGFSITTRELARRLDVTQPLLYRYFPSKEALIEEVCEVVYQRRWRAEWDTILGDMSRSVRDRLILFYRDYTRVVFERTLLRVFLFSGLKDPSMNRRCLDRTYARLFIPILKECRRENGREDEALTAEEFAQICGMHGSICHHVFRVEVLFQVPPADLELMIETSVDMMLHGLKRVYADMASGT